MLGQSICEYWAMGHINSATKLKDWPQGLQLLLNLDQNL
jgi:predicted alpha/beta hydrolase family esterase